ncbi:MAG: tripartite tricarboxylate transporter TctB family protein [Lachnospiraceae bacterium]|nr:tripartite tricarboxylate transporter TctB family protein [Lachnospiraceae bacterium]
MEKIIVGIWALNLVASVVFAILGASKRQKMWLAAFFAVFPVMGFVIYFLPQWILNIRKKYSYDRESLVRRFDIEQAQAVPVVEKELNVIPIEDAMAVSNNKEKRSLLLEQLKKDIHTNYKVVLPAGGDNDSESAHYVAAAKMEVYRKKYAELSEVQKELEKEPKNMKILQKYLKELESYIGSELLAEKEAEVYKAEYCEKLEQAAKVKDNGMTAEEYSCYIVYLIELKKYKEAETFWGKCEESKKNEAAYWKVLEMYYNMGEKQKFYKCLDSLESSQIKLSPEGLKMLRYWTERR